MPTSTLYNGWRNRTTWNIMLWLDNDEPMYRAYVARVRQLIAFGLRLSGRRARNMVIDLMGSETPDGCKVTAKCVDWRAIAEGMRESAEG